MQKTYVGCCFDKDQGGFYLSLASITESAIKRGGVVELYEGEKL